MAGSPAARAARLHVSDGRRNGRSTPHLRAARPPGAGHRRAAASARRQRGTGPLALSFGAGIRGRAFWLLLRRRRGRAGLPAPFQPDARAAAGHRRRRAGAGGADDPGACRAAARGGHGRAGPGHPSLAGHRHLTGRGRARLATPGGRPRHAGPLAVHLGRHGNAAGRDAEPRQPPAQLAADPARVWPHRRLAGRKLAAPLPRHGPHRRAVAAGLRGLSLHFHVAHCLFAAALPLAARHLALPRHHKRRPQLCLRPLRAQDPPGAARHLGPELLGSGV
ncbi:MAG: hypothetical protein KatS3mg131_2596 [Candidatus Tectimicrobiota bacterium]|nr:MAG: hypothetical protein KatS3mg131_2596 [Candidatus Tectomicrobia bacterium]